LDGSHVQANVKKVAIDLKGAWVGEGDAKWQRKSAWQKPPKGGTITAGVVYGAVTSRKRYVSSGLKTLKRRCLVSG